MRGGGGRLGACWTARAHQLVVLEVRQSHGLREHEEGRGVIQNVSRHLRPTHLACCFLEAVAVLALAGDTRLLDGRVVEPTSLDEAPLRITNLDERGRRLLVWAGPGRARRRGRRVFGGADGWRPRGGARRCGRAARGDIFLVSQHNPVTAQPRWRMVRWFGGVSARARCGALSFLWVHAVLCHPQRPAKQSVC